MELCLILCCSTVNCILIIDFLKKMCVVLWSGLWLWKLGREAKNWVFFFQIELIEFCELGLCQV